MLNYELIDDEVLEIAILTEFFDLHICIECIEITLKKRMTLNLARIVF